MISRLMKLLLFSTVLFFSIPLMAQKSVQGTAIPEYGNVFKVDTDYKTDTHQVMKVVFEVTKAGDSLSTNGFFDSVARFMNMNHMAGIPMENMHLALVIHGQAVVDILNNETYHAFFPGADKNPNLDLLAALKEKNVEIITCGQSLAALHISKDQISENVDVALSAMTALVQLQNQDYRLIKF